MTDASSRIEALEKRRADRLAAHKRARDEQHAADLEAFVEIEEQHDPGAVTTLAVDGEDGRRFTPGLPTFAAFRRPSSAEVKRFRDRCKPKNQNQEVDTRPALIELATVCLVYPSADVFARMLETYPGLDVQGGKLAAKLAVGREEADLKD